MVFSKYFTFLIKMFDYTGLQEIKEGKSHCVVIILLEDNDTLFLQLMVNSDEFKFICDLKKSFLTIRYSVW